MVELINSDPQVLDALVTCDESWIYCYDPDTKRQSSQWKHAGSPRPKKARQSKSTQKLMMIPFFDSMGIIYIHWVPTGITVNKEYYIEVLREFRKGFRRKRPELFESGQCPDRTGPIESARTLLPATFGYSQSSRKTSEAIVIPQLRT